MIDRLLVGLAWLGVVVVSLVALLLLARSRRQGLAFWTLSVAVLGPVGLLAWLIAACGRRPRALIETVGDLPPNVVGTVVALETAVLVPGVGQNVGLLLLALYCIPLAVRLFLYQASLLARPMGIGYARTVLRRLPAALISTNLAIAGLLAASLPLVNWHVNYCGLGRFAVLQWWAIAVLGALVGGLLIYAYHAWTVRRGSTAWSALLWGTGEAGDDTTTVSCPPWRRLWLWIVLSVVILVVGVAVGVWGITITASAAGG